MRAPDLAPRIVLATRPVSFQKGIDGLAGVAENELGLDPYSGVAVVFRCQEHRDLIKVLWWDGSSLVLMQKRLERGRFYARSGLDLDRSTLAGWVGKASFHLKPVVERLAEHLRQSGKLFMDETRAPVLDPGRGRTKTGWLWALARDDRNWGGGDPPGVVYFYAPSRSGEHAERFLDGFEGILQVDGYAGYNRLARTRNGVRLAYCWLYVAARIMLRRAGTGVPGLKILHIPAT